MSRIKVLVVDDSAFMRKVLKDLLESDPQLEVVGTARHGQDALDKIPSVKPDVVTLDVEMPILDGLSTLAKIVKEYQLPVIMLSSTTRAGTEQTLLAIENGAFDFVAKPSGSISLDIGKVKEELIEKVKLAYQCQVEKKQVHAPKVIRSRISTTTLEQKIRPTPKTNSKSTLQYLILIGTSTGGPKALQQVLLSLPKLEKAAIVIVQHMPPTFTKSLANRLDQITKHKVVEARDGELINGGYVYIAPGGFHVHLNQRANEDVIIHLGLDPPRKGHRPAVDVLYESAIQVNNLNIITVIMTGMGRDGTEGLKKLREKKEIYAIAEDESTCVVYGMPKSAIEAQLINEIVPLDQISFVLRRLINE